MPDGTVLAGISPDTNKPMYATPADASLTMTFNEAQEYAAKLDAHGHKDWRVPTKAELNVLFNNRAAIGGFNVSWFQSRRLVLVRVARPQMGCVVPAVPRRGSGHRNKIYHLSVRPVR